METSALEDVENSSCYSSGSIAISVILTLIVTILLVFVANVIWKQFRRRKNESQMVQETDVEKGKEGYSYDNDGFNEQTLAPLNSSTPISESNSKLDSCDSKWRQWAPFGVLTPKNGSHKTVDDSVLQTKSNEIKSVALKSHDFTGLGFNICGNLREGIFIKDVLHRGPASESGKLNPGDRIKSVTINFEHVVYEDALTILSYASPYEIVLEAQSGKMPAGTTMDAAELRHPLFRSSSTVDLSQLKKMQKKQLFPTINEKPVFRSPFSTLQKQNIVLSDLLGVPPKKETKSESPNNKSAISTSKSKGQREFTNDQDEGDLIIQKTENKHQKFGVKVLPSYPMQSRDQIMLKNSELSQNDNNINLERQSTENMEIEEVDGHLEPNGVVTKREKTAAHEEASDKVDYFTRSIDLNGSGIKRDKNGIPQEIPGHMLNAAMAARKYRKGSVENVSSDEGKQSKKPKGRAPAPPEEMIKTKLTLDDDDTSKTEENAASVKIEDLDETQPSYDSDSENDHLSSVNTIELNPSEITIHHVGDQAETRSRKTVSTGDLTKMQKITSTSISGTLERAQSLDITDTTMSTLDKVKKIGGSIEESLLETGHQPKSLDDGLNTFQRSRLKKSTEWGNLEDVSLDEPLLASTRAQFDGFLINRLDGVRPETPQRNLNADKSILAVENLDEPLSGDFEIIAPFEATSLVLGENPPLSLEINSSESIIEILDDEVMEKPQQTSKLPLLNGAIASETFLLLERSASNQDSFYYIQTNVSDDMKRMKVSRHTLGSLEKPPSNVTIISSAGEERPRTEFRNITKYLVGEDANKKDNVDYPDDTKVSVGVVTLKNSSKVEEIDEKEKIILEVHRDEIVAPLSNLERLLEPKSSNTQSVSIPPSTRAFGTVDVQMDSSPPTYITEITVSTTANNAHDHKWQGSKNSANETLDPQKELHKIREMAEEQLKKLPEMRFSTSSYESPSNSPENKLSHIEQLRSNFETTPPRSLGKTDSMSSLTKSRIPVATSKTPPTSPERRDSRIFNLEMDKDIVAIMSSPIQSATTSSGKYPAKATANKNVSVTSIRNNSKIPSGLPSSRPPVPPRKHETNDHHQGSHWLSNSNGNLNDNSFKQWVFTSRNEDGVEHFTSTSNNNVDRQ